ncbi:MAG TPA: 4-(cytidine 5'-diphospho)-2-C-methyl-D-erythritol kinase [Armatimonadota bacterium]|nr:4-(cytidine 5'-diphospho)-2-C-methyl-D-erythritol kinase [Armatimonadota bacterium]HQK94645.1 4-(cytidine 5'-diphospho)-2-C-methyl-D-erythritol kinase [Armatimonadota bacterium]
MRDSVRLRSPAKVNLYLDVHSGRRDDGYHSLCTLVQAVGLFDQVEIRRRPHGIRVRTDAPDVPADGTNLAARAAAAFLAACDVDEGVDICLLKAIPARAGLGGGSSNAAATLVGCRELFGLDVTDAELCRLAAGLGADVPFFVRGGTQVGHSRGEILEAVEPPLVGWVVIAKGSEGASTPDVYAEFDRAPERAPMTIDVALERIRQRQWSALWNGLQGAALRVAPAIRETRARLAEVSLGPVVVAGSGSSVFAVFSDAASAQAACARVAPAVAFSRACPMIPRGVEVVG